MVTFFQKVTALQPAQNRASSPFQDTPAARGTSEEHKRKIPSVLPARAEPRHDHGLPAHSSTAGAV